MSPERAGQVWYGDFFIGLLVFGIGIGLYLSFSPNLKLSGEEFSSVSEQSYAISSSLLSEGYPPDWDDGTVVSIGLTDGGRNLDFEKYSRFAELDYSKAKHLLGVTADFYVGLQNSSDHLFLNNTCGVGHTAVQTTDLGGGRCNLSLSGVGSDTLAQSRRLLLANGTTTHLVVYAWS